MPSNLTLRCSFQWCRRIFPNWSMSKVEKTVEGSIIVKLSSQMPPTRLRYCLRYFSDILERKPSHRVLRGWHTINKNLKSALSGMPAVKAGMASVTVTSTLSSEHWVS